MSSIYHLQMTVPNMEQRKWREIINLAQNIPIDAQIFQGGLNTQAHTFDI